MAVQLFFIISGFYMALVLNEKYIGKNNSLKLFFSNRFLKLFPAYWIILILTFLFLGILYLKNPYELSNHNFFIFWNRLHPFSLLFLIFTNVFILFLDVFLFLNLDLNSGLFYITTNTDYLLHYTCFLPVAWSISLEIMFYLIAPFIVKSKPKLLIIIAISLVLRILFMQQGLTYAPFDYRFFPLELVFFCGGSWVYYLYKALKKVSISKNILKSIAIFIFLCIIFGNRLGLHFVYNWQNAVFYIVFSLGIPFIFQLTKKSKMDRQIGELSYPFYLSHMLIYAIIPKIASKIHFPYLAHPVIIIGITIIFSYILYHFFIKKIEFFRQKRVHKS